MEVNALSAMLQREARETEAVLRLRDYPIARREEAAGVESARPTTNEPLQRLRRSDPAQGRSVEQEARRVRADATQLIRSRREPLDQLVRSGADLQCLPLRLASLGIK